MKIYQDLGIESTSSLIGNNIKELFKHIKKQLEEIRRKKKITKWKTSEFNY